MLKLFLKHWTLEKCIDIIFDNIARSFKKPPIPRIIRFTQTRLGNKLVKTLTTTYKGADYTITNTYADKDIRDLMKHGVSEDHVHDLLEEGLKQQMDLELKLMEDPDYFETHPEDFIPVDMTDEAVNEDIFEAYKRQTGEDITMEEFMDMVKQD